MRSYILPTLMAVAAVRAVELEEFVPECAPACIYEAVDSHSTCEPNDSACLCRDIYSLKRHSEDCLEETCSEAAYGEAMLGYDNFCDAVENGEPEPTVTTSTTATVPDDTPTTSVPPPPETTVEPPPETESPTEEPTEVPTEVPTEEPTVEPTEEPTEEPTGPPTDNPEWPPSNTMPEVPTSMTIPVTDDLPTITTSVTTGNGTIPVPTETEPVPTTTSGGDEDGGEEETTGGASPTAAAGRLDASVGALAGGLLLAALLRM